MPQIQGGSSSTGGRLDGSLQHTAVATSNFALGVGWGDTAALTLDPPSGAVCTDQRGRISITAGGSGLAQATATVVFTFADGAWATPPIAIVTTSNDNSIDTGHVTWSTTTTALTLTFSVLPVNTKIYKLSYALIE